MRQREYIVVKIIWSKNQYECQKARLHTRFIKIHGSILYCDVSLHLRILKYYHKARFIIFPQFTIIFKYGFLRVDLFFMISGYVIMRTSLNRDIKTFFIAKFSRLYPTF